MKDIIKFISLALVLLSVSRTSADLYSERAKVTLVCNQTISRCVWWFRVRTARTNTMWCSQLRFYNNGVTFLQ